MTTLVQAVSDANKILPGVLRAAHGHLLVAHAQFEPCTFDVEGARRALHFVDRVRPYASSAAHALDGLRRDLVDAIVAAGGEPSPHHPHAAKHHALELCARAARAIRSAVDARHFDAPAQYARRTDPHGVVRTCSGHDGFDDARALSFDAQGRPVTDPDYLADWLHALAQGDAARNTGADRAHAWMRQLAELRDAHAKAA